MRATTITAIATAPAATLGPRGRAGPAGPGSERTGTPGPTGSGARRGGQADDPAARPAGSRRGPPVPDDRRRLCRPPPPALVRDRRLPRGLGRGVYFSMLQRKIPLRRGIYHSGSRGRGNQAPRPWRRGVTGCSPANKRICMA